MANMKKMQRSMPKKPGKPRKKVAGKVRNRDGSLIDNFKQKVSDVVNRNDATETAGASTETASEGSVITLERGMGYEVVNDSETADVVNAQVERMDDGHKNLVDNARIQAFGDDTEASVTALVPLGEQGITDHELPGSVTMVMPGQQGVTTPELPGALALMSDEVPDRDYTDILQRVVGSPEEDAVTDDVRTPPTRDEVLETVNSVTGSDDTGFVRPPGVASKLKAWGKQKYDDHVINTDAYYASKGGYTGFSPSEVAARKEGLERKVAQRTEELNVTIPAQIKALQNEINDLQDQRMVLTNQLKGRPPDAYSIQMEISRIDRDIRTKRDEITRLQTRTQTLRTEIEKFGDEKITLDSVGERYKASVAQGRRNVREEQKKSGRLQQQPTRSGGRASSSGFKGGDLTSVISSSKIDIGKNMNSVIGTGVGARGRPITDVVGTKRGSGIPLSSALTPVRGQQTSVFGEEGALPKYGRWVKPTASVRGAISMADIIGNKSRRSGNDMFGDRMQRPQVAEVTASYGRFDLVRPRSQPQFAVQNNETYTQDGVIAATPAARKSKKGKGRKVDRKTKKTVNCKVDLKKGVIKNPVADIRNTHAIITSNFTVPSINAKGLTKFDGLKITPTKFDLKKKIKLK